MGGKGLRQWQISQRKAFMNGWSMIDRLTHLEDENANLRKENNLLKKASLDSNFTVILVPAPYTHVKSYISHPKQPTYKGIGIDNAEPPAMLPPPPPSPPTSP